VTPGARYTNRKTGRTVTLIEPAPGGTFRAGSMRGDNAAGWRARYDEGNTTRLLERTLKRSWLPEGDPRLVVGLDTTGIRARAAAATEGPWELWTGCSWRRFGSAPTGRAVCEPVTQRDGQPDLYFPNGGQDGPDATFIAHARTDIPALLAEVRRLRALVKGGGR
jgi:hypothetical protein